MALVGQGVVGGRGAAELGPSLPQPDDGADNVGREEANMLDARSSMLILNQNRALLYNKIMMEICL